MHALLLLLATAPAEAAERTSDDAKAMLAVAIERGAPLYNQGSIEGCAAVYEVTAVALVRFGADELSDADRDLLASTLNVLPPDANGRAWALRRSFDAVLGTGPRPNGPVGGGSALPKGTELPLGGDWNEVDDRVMGGISKGSAAVNEDGHVIWTGRMTTESNGGFVTTRTQFEPLNLSESTGLRLRVRGDGRTFKVTMNTNRSHGRGVGMAQLPTRAGQWTEVDLPFSAFTGRMYGGTIRLDKSRVQSLQFQLSGAEQVGEYQLEIGSVQVY
ncbi:MAG: CIA30 family protein [Myxococcota bacterium]